MLNILNNTSGVVTDLHLRCITRVVNLEIGDCLKEVTVMYVSWDDTYFNSSAENVIF